MDIEKRYQNYSYHYYFSVFLLLVKGFGCTQGWRKKSGKGDEAPVRKMGARGACYLAGLRGAELI